MKTSSPLSLIAAICMALVSPAWLASADEGEASDTVSAVEIAYWTRLQQELLDLRTGNLRAGIRVMPLTGSAPALAEMAERLDAFLDRRDADPVNELGADFLAYRELVVQLVDQASTPVLEAVQFHSRVETSGVERMRITLTNQRGVDAVNQLKPRLMVMHEELNHRIRAAGGPSVPFFQVIGIGDAPQVQGKLDDQSVRDARFLEDVNAINPHLGALVTPMFFDRRDEMGVAPQQLIEMFSEAVADMRARAEGASLDEIRAVIFSQPETRDDGSVNTVHYLLRLALLAQENTVGFQLNMQEFQGAYARWIGESDELAPVGAPLNVAVSRDGSWFSYAEDAHTLVTRGVDGALIHRLESYEPIRTLDIMVDGQLHYFTTRGVYSIRPTPDTPTRGLEAERPSRFIQPLLASARDLNRSVFAIGVMPGMVTGLSENTFAAANPGSRISAVGISGDGTRVVYGYAADRFLPQGSVMSGFHVLVFEDEVVDQSEEIISWSGTPFLSGPVTALAVNTDGSMVAAAVHGQYGGNVMISTINEGRVTDVSVSLDAQRYTWLHLIEDDTPLLVAGTASGQVRVWGIPSMELKLSIEIPAGPEGLGYAILGGDLLTVAVGAASVHRWSLSDGKHLAALLGEAPEVDAEVAEARFLAEREQRSIVQPLLITAIRGRMDERPAAIRSLQSDHADAVAQLGLTDTVRYIRFQRRYTEIRDQYQNRNYAEAFTMGKDLIDEGYFDHRLLHLTAEAGFNDVLYGRQNRGMFSEVAAIARQGLELYPTDIQLQKSLHEIQAYQFLYARRVADALAEVDSLGVLEPSKAPHVALRQYILETGQLQAADAGNPRMAGRYLLESSRLERDPARKSILAQNAFAYANQVQDWQTVLDAAMIALDAEPSLQHNQSFMHWARHAYQQVNR